MPIDGQLPLFSRDTEGELYEKDSDIDEDLPSKVISTASPLPNDDGVVQTKVESCITPISASQ
jgi:hypothetical protein